MCVCVCVCVGGGGGGGGGPRYKARDSLILHPPLPSSLYNSYLQYAKASDENLGEGGEEATGIVGMVVEHKALVDVLLIFSCFATHSCLRLSRSCLSASCRKPQRTAVTNHVAVPGHMTVMCSWFTPRPLITAVCGLGMRLQIYIYHGADLPVSVWEE